MSEQDGRTPRQRPVYGLPAETPPAAQPAPYGQPGQYGAPEQPGQQGQPRQGDPQQPAGQQGQYGQSSPSWSSASSAAAGPQLGVPSAPVPQGGPIGPGGYAPAPAAPRRRSGTIPLVSGLVLMLLIAPAALILGLVLSVQHLVSDATTGPTPIAGATTSVEMPANSMVIVYVAEADAATAQCTAESDGTGAVTVVPQSSTVQFGNGSTYHQVLGAVVQSDTTVTISCTGTTSDPAYLGPYSVFGVAGPMMAGIGGSILIGLIGLVLLIVGIVLKVRARRA